MKLKRWNLTPGFSLISGVMIAIFGIVFSSAVVFGQDGFVPIFDGKSLIVEGDDQRSWIGQDQSFWSVEDGAICGTISKEHSPTANQYLVWQGGKLTDFELKLKFRLLCEKEKHTNGGFQFRSRLLPDGDVAGYQVDVEFGHPWQARLYDEYGRHTLAYQGARTSFGPNGRYSNEKLENADQIKPIALEVWNDFHLRAVGSKLTLTINGEPIAEVVDDDPVQNDLAGILALQLHTGPQMKAQFKDILLKKRNE